MDTRSGVAESQLPQPIAASPDGIGGGPAARFFNEVFVACWHLCFAWVPSIPGRWRRQAFLRLALKECGGGLRVSTGVHIAYPRRIRLGRDVWIGRDCHIEGIGGIRVGDHTFISFRSILQTSGPDVVTGGFSRHERVVSGPIVIGHDSRLCASAIVRYGVHVGDHVVVAMGAVVVKDVPDWTMVAGVPARVVRPLTVSPANVMPRRMRA